MYGCLILYALFYKRILVIMSREATRFSIKIIFFEEKTSNFRSIFQHIANAKYCQNHRTGKISFQIHIP